MQRPAVFPLRSRCLKIIKEISKTSHEPANYCTIPGKPFLSAGPDPMLRGIGSFLHPENRARPPSSLCAQNAVVS